MYLFTSLDYTTYHQASQRESFFLLHVVLPCLVLNRLSFHYILGEMIERPGLRRTRLHSLRLTYASLLIAQEDSLFYVRDQMGYHSLQVIVDLSGHLVS